jgi:hypothetical protein
VKSTLGLWCIANPEIRRPHRQAQARVLRRTMWRSSSSGAYATAHHGGVNSWRM